MTRIVRLAKPHKQRDSISSGGRFWEKMVDFYPPN